MSWCQPVFRRGEGGERDASVDAAADERDAKDAFAMDVTARSECWAVAAWSDAERAAGVSGGLFWAGSW